MSPLSAYQAAGLSQEARDFMGKIPWVPFPALLAYFLTGPSSVSGMRKQFQDSEDIIEEGLIKKHNLKIESKTVANVPILIIEPPTIKPGMEGKIMFNIHGGGFVMGTARDRSALLMAIELGIRVYSVEYTLSPEAKYPVARDECLAVYWELVETFDAKNIFGMSSSAGGHLMLSMMVLAQREKLPMVAGLVFFTPGADMSGRGDSKTSNATRDVMHPAFLTGLLKNNYLGDPGFLPSVITTGTRDLLMSPSINLYWKLREVSEKVEMLISDGMWHGYNWEVEMPEAVRVRSAVYKFVQELVEKK